MRWSTLPILLVIPTALCAHDRIAYIEFFGYQGIDVRAVRQALPFREGEALRPEIEDQARSAVKRVTGRDATDVGKICCTGSGDFAIFIGVAGSSSHSFTFDSAPAAAVTPPRELTELVETMVGPEQSQRAADVSDPIEGSCSAGTDSVRRGRRTA